MSDLIKRPPEGETSLAPLDPIERERVRSLIEDAWASETRRAYRWAWNRFELWSKRHGFDPIPADPASIALCMDDLITEGVSASTIRTMLSAIKWIHEAAGKPSPTYSAPVKLAWKAVTRRIGTSAKHPKDPATLDLIERMLSFDRTTLAGKRDAAVILVGFHAALRRKELASILVEHVKFVREGMTIFIPRSKTDQAGTGESVGIASSDDELCAVRAVHEWLDASGIKTGKLFRSFTLDHHIRETFHSASVADVVKKRAGAAKLEVADFAGHSLRAGFVTEAYRRGAGEAEIMGTTRHRNVGTLIRYRREADPIARGASRRMRKKTKET